MFTYHHIAHRHIRIEKAQIAMRNKTIETHTNTQSTYPQPRSSNASENARRIFKESLLWRCKQKRKMFVRIPHCCFQIK